MSLHNKKSKEQLLEELNSDNRSRITCSFYKYTPLNDLSELRDQLYLEWSELDVLGRIYLANEGINAQFSIPEENYDQFVQSLQARSEFVNIMIKQAVEEGLSFLKLTIKIRPEIVAYQVPADEYNMEITGDHLDYQEFNQAIANGATVVDMRNQYEAEVGHFENAIIPAVERSQELLPEVKKQLQGKEDEEILIYCTGGIRCEKASAYLINHGFKNVKQLLGGVIQYANDVKKNKADSKFIGKNFVFDHRLGERVTDDVISFCHTCDNPSDNHTNCANPACHVLFIQCEDCANQNDGCCTKKCADFIKLPIEEQRRLRKNSQTKFTAHLSDRIKPKLKELPLDSFNQ